MASRTSLRIKADESALAEGVANAVRMATRALDGLNMPDEELDELCDALLSTESGQMAVSPAET